LSENRAETYRRNSDALALDRAGVKHELRDIDAQIGLMPRRGLKARLAHALQRAPADQ
jgi:hypothetical protein